MSSYKLRRELLDDPQAKGYSSMSDAEADASLSDGSVYPLRGRRVITRDDLYEAADTTEMDALQAAAITDPTDGIKNVAQRRLDRLNFLMLKETISLEVGAKDLADLQVIFSSSPITVTNLLTLRNRTVSRYDDLGIKASSRDADGVFACRVPDQPPGVVA